LDPPASAEGALDESFFVLYGDSFLPVDFAPIWSAFQSGRAPAGRAPALMTVLRNEGRWDSSNVVYSNGLVTLYDKRAANPEMLYIDYGLSAFRRAVIEQSTDADLSTLFHRLSVAGDLAGYEVTDRFYEIGSPQGLRDLELLLPSLP
jgi:NDP-sugar pyrophosphorylase family protein